MSLPILYVKDGCPWCIEAINYFQEIRLNYEPVDVRINPDKMKDLIECSGQNKTPTLKNGDFIIADFDIEEFKSAIKRNPDEAKKLGLN